MPLKPGSGPKVVGSNIKELMDTYMGSGKIGTSTPPNKQAAVKQAAAIAYSQAGEGPRDKKNDKSEGKADQRRDRRGG